VPKEKNQATFGYNITGSLEIPIHQDSQPNELITKNIFQISEKE
jgi:hypothetical protein